MPSRHAATIHAANAALLVDGDVSTIADTFGEDYVAHVTGQDVGGGHATIRRIITALRQAFPELQVDVEILVEADDRVAWQRTLRGTHVAAFQGFPATGRPLVWREMLTSRFEDGRIVEEWLVSDMAEQLLRARKG